MIIAYSIEDIVNEQNAEHNEQAEDAQPKYVVSLEEDPFHFQGWNLVWLFWAIDWDNTIPWFFVIYTYLKQREREKKRTIYLKKFNIF